jgi:flagellar basal-body rod modification protein FlgD
MNIQGITPDVAAPLQAQSTSSPRATTNGSSSTGSTGLLGGSAASLQDTFLNLLVTELQNQDPTSPVDPTQMVGQMVSLNQLDQLMAINSTLSGMANGNTSAAAPSTGSTATAQVASGTAGSSSESTSAPRVAGGSTSTPMQPAYTPADANAMMNLYGSVASAATVPTTSTAGGR